MADKLSPSTAAAPQGREEIASEAKTIPAPLLQRKILQRRNRKAERAADLPAQAPPTQEGGDTPLPPEEAKNDAITLEQLKQLIASGASPELIHKKVLEYLCVRDTDNSKTKGDAPLLLSICRAVTPPLAIDILLNVTADVDIGAGALLRAGKLSPPIWADYMAGRKGEDYVHALEDPLLFQRLRSWNRDPFDLCPALLYSATDLVSAASLAGFREWVRERTPAARQQQLSDLMNSVQSALGKQSATGEADLRSWIMRLPPGPATDQAVRDRLQAEFQLSTDLPLCEEMFQKRWGITADAVKGGEIRWSKQSLMQVWSVCEEMPPDHVRGIKSVRLAEKMDPTIAADYSATTKQIGVKQGITDEVEAVPMAGGLKRTMAVFNHTFRHEIGHHVAGTLGLDGPGGWVDKVAGWQRHVATAELLRKFAASHPLTGANGEEAEKVYLALATMPPNYRTDAVQKAINHKQHGLYAKVAHSPLLAFLNEIASDDRHGKTEGHQALFDQTPIGGRCYFGNTYYNHIFSVPKTTVDQRLTDYSLFSPPEWFAELYAVYYDEAERPGRPMGQAVAMRNRPLAEQFRGLVDPQHNLAPETQQVPPPGAPVNGSR